MNPETEAVSGSWWPAAHSTALHPYPPNSHDYAVQGTQHTAPAAWASTRSGARLRAHGGRWETAAGGRGGAGAGRRAPGGERSVRQRSGRCESVPARAQAVEGTAQAITSGTTPLKLARKKSMSSPGDDAGGWLDESMVNKAQRSWRAGIGQLRNTFEKTQTTCEQVVGRVKAGKLESNEHFENSFKLCERRTAVAIKVMHTDSEHLDAWRVALQNGGPAAAEALERASEGGGGGEALQGKAQAARAPPCRNGLDLRTFGQLQAMAKLYETARQVEDLKSVSSQISTFKIAVQQLLQAWKSSVTDRRVTICVMCFAMSGLVWA